MSNRLCILRVHSSSSHSQTLVGSRLWSNKLSPLSSILIAKRLNLFDSNDMASEATIDSLKRNVWSVHSEEFFDGFLPTSGCFMGRFASLLTLLRCTSSEFTCLFIQFIGCMLGTIRHYTKDTSSSFFLIVATHPCQPLSSSGRRRPMQHFWQIWQHFSLLHRWGRENQTTSFTGNRFPLTIANSCAHLCSSIFHFISSIVGSLLRTFGG